MKKLALKTILGMLNLFAMMGLAIFLPAGTFSYPQAWCYLAVFFGGVTVITVYIFINDRSLLQSRLKVGATAEKRTAQQIIQAAASIGFIGMYVVSGFDRRFGWSCTPGWLWIFSEVMLAITWALFFTVFRKNTFLSATIEVQAHQRIVTDGPYAVVRHPMYSAGMLLFLFTPPALGSYRALLTFPLMFLVLALRCLDEEKALKAELPGYEDYCHRVRWRIIPGLW
jgi:protein-S-isoprenylcysteine O-methyltransferase Ste14